MGRSAPDEDTTFASYSSAHSDQTPPQPGAPIAHLIERPTAIEMVHFAATMSAEGVVVEWATLVESWTQGYLILRGEAADGSDAVQMTPDLIAGHGGGSTYRWFDRMAQPGRAYFYWIVVVEVDGARTSYGPVWAGNQRFYLPLVSNG